MPIYEYRCKECGHELDVIQKVDDDPLRDCPSCEQPALRKLVSAPSFRLKGSGWYETDFKKDNRRNLAESGDKAEKSDGNKADKSDKKDAASKDSASKKESTPKSDSSPGKKSSSA